MSTPAPQSPAAAEPRSAAAGEAPGLVVAGKSAAGPGIHPRTWTVALPAGIRLLNANERLHWAKRASITRDIRKAAWACAKAAQVPPLARARIAVEYQPPRKSRTRDGGNWSPSGKAAIDGLRDAGVIRDDESRIVTEEAYRIGEPYPRGRLVLHVTEVA